MRSSWQKMTQELNLEKKVKFTGTVPWEEIPQYIGGFDVGYCGSILPSWGKMYHSPLKLYEYMAMAKPVIASGFDQAKKIVSENVTGFLYQIGDQQDLKQVLLKAYQSQHLLPGMGQKARDEMTMNHDWTVRVKFLMEELDRRLEKNYP